MKLKSKLLVMSLLMMLVGLVGCSSDDNVTAEDMMPPMKNATVELVPKEDLPVWLSEKVERLEVQPSLVAYIYQSSWRGETVFWIWSSFSSCVICDIYTTEGENVTFENDAVIEEFARKSDYEWKCIYKVVGHRE